MRHASSRPPAGSPLPNTHAWQTLTLLFPYLWRYRWRVGAALSCLVGAKVANVGVPLIFKQMIDGLSPEHLPLALPALLLGLYGALRFATSLFTELREILFARVTQRAVRQVALEVFRHLPALSLRFHLERQTGGLTRDIERGTRALQSLVSYVTYGEAPQADQLAPIARDRDVKLIVLSLGGNDLGFASIVTAWTGSRSIRPAPAPWWDHSAPRTRPPRTPSRRSNGSQAATRSLRPLTQ